MIIDNDDFIPFHFILSYLWWHTRENSSICTFLPFLFLFSSLFNPLLFCCLSITLNHAQWKLIFLVFPYSVSVCTTVCLISIFFFTPVLVLFLNLHLIPPLLLFLLLPLLLLLYLLLLTSSHSSTSFSPPTLCNQPTLLEYL